MLVARTFGLLTGVLTAVAARAVAPMAVPFYVGVVLLSSVLFGGNGIHAATVTRAALGGPALGVGLLAAWVLMTAPMARAVLDLPSTHLLRALPVPRWHFEAVAAAHLAALHLPWVVLWGRGEGIAAGLSAAAIAIGAQCFVLAPPRRATEIAAAAALAAAAIVGPGGVTLAIAVVSAAIGVDAAWRRAPERAARGSRGGLPQWPAAAIGAALWIAARRREPGAFVRGAIFVALGGFATPMAARGHDIETAAAMSAMSLQIAAFTLSVACAGIGAAVLRAEAGSRWLLDSTGIGGRLRVIAAAGATGAVGAALGLLHGTLAAVGLGGTGAAAVGGAAAAARLVGLGGAWGVAVGLLCAWHARRADLAGPRRDRWGPARFVAGMGICIAMVRGLGEIAAAIVAAIAIALNAASARGAAALPPPRCARTTPIAARAVVG